MENAEWLRPSGQGCACPRWEVRRVVGSKIGVQVVALGSIWKEDGSSHGNVFYQGRTKLWPCAETHATCTKLGLEGQEMCDCWWLAFLPLQSMSGLTLLGTRG